MTIVTEYKAPFLYEHLVLEAVSPRGAKTLLLTGGISTGKSTVLQRLCAEFKGDVEPVVIQAGMDKDLMIKAVANAIDGDLPLFIDDIDRFFDLEVAEALRGLESPRRKQKTVVTSTLPPDLANLRAGNAFKGVTWDKRTLDAWSIVTMTFATRSVDPWSPGWHRRLADHVMRITGEKTSSGWATVVLHITGGHPVLLDAALEALDIQKVKRGVATLDELAVPPAEWQRRVSQLEDEIFASGFRRLRRGLLDLEKRDPDAMEALQAISRGETEMSASSTAAKRSLLVSGLVHRTMSQPFVIAGETLRRYLAGDSEMRQPSVDIVATDAERGDLVIQIGNERRTVPLRAASWRLLKALRDAKSDFVALAALHKKAGVADQNAVRSALQRLKAEIQKGGYDEIVENVWGAGYRMGTFPLTVLAGTND